MRREGPDPRGFCTPECIWFKCEKRALQIRGSTLWCSWLNDVCIGPSCSFASCVRNKLLPENRCGLVVKRMTKDVIKLEDIDVKVKIPGKLAHKLGHDRDIV